MKLFPRIIPLASAGIGASLLLPAAARAEGMPQLDFTTPLTISQVIWGAIIFLLLYRLLSRNALPLVSSVLEERAAKISLDLDGARAAKARADAGVEEANAATARARADAQHAINAAVAEAKKEAAARAEVLNARLEKQLAESEVQIAAARASAMKMLRQVATETAATVVTRLTGVSPDAGRLDGAVGSALSARGIA
nr:F0F1 ATP synthase subunit B' [uncultured Rhodopila sp.]